MVKKIDIYFFLVIITLLLVSCKSDINKLEIFFYDKHIYIGQDKEDVKSQLKSSYFDSSINRWTFNEKVLRNNKVLNIVGSLVFTNNRLTKCNYSIININSNQCELITNDFKIYLKKTKIDRTYEVNKQTTYYDAQNNTISFNRDCDNTYPELNFIFYKRN